MRSIIINRMYAGEYLTKGIGGGEVINLLHADDGNNYCFINPTGMLNPSYNDSVCAVVHTRLYEAGCFEVLGVSLIEPKGQLIYPKGYTNAERVLSSVSQLKEYASAHQVHYGGVPYVKDSDTWPSISFVSSKLLRPRSQIYIIDSDYDKKISSHLPIYRLADKRFAKQSLRMYVDDDQNPKSFDCIFEMIDNKELWNDRIITVNDSSKHYYNRFNFLTLINKEDDELSFSNMYHYFFQNYIELFVTFSKEVLNLNVSDKCEIKREFHNIDLWIEDEENVIVIENKIKSGINGVSDRHDFNENGLVQSQLSKYYAYATNYSSAKNKKVSCFLFVPNYNKLDLTSYCGSKHYKVIRYKDIYHFFMTKKINDPYYTDFCNALYKHTKDIPVDYSEIVMNYLIKQIQKHKK